MNFKTIVAIIGLLTSSLTFSQENPIRQIKPGERIRLQAPDGTEESYPGGTQIEILGDLIVSQKGWRYYKVKILNTPSAADKEYRVSQTNIDQFTEALPRTKPTSNPSAQTPLAESGYTVDGCPTVIQNEEVVSSQREFQQILTRLTRYRAASVADYESISATCSLYNSQICSAYEQVFKNPVPDLDTFAFVKAIIQQESGHDQRAFRFEDRELRKSSWVASVWNDHLQNKNFPAEPNNDSEEVRRFESSYGLMQILYPVVRGDYDYKDRAEFLLIPSVNLYYGLTHLKNKLSQARKYQQRNPNSSFSIWDLASASYNYGTIRSAPNGTLRCHDRYYEKVRNHQRFYRTNCGFGSVEEACNASSQ